jgi:hypothetical protein
MLEIFSLYFLCKKIGGIAHQKGLSQNRWKIYTFLAWIGFEILGAIISVALFGFDMNNLMGLGLFALASAFGGYLLILRILENKPDRIEE